MNKYNAVVILNPNISKKKLNYIQRGIINLFEQNSKLQKVYVLGKQNLDIKLKKYTEGFYLKFEITSKEKSLEKIRQVLNENHNVISHHISIDNCKNTHLPILKKVTIPFNTFQKGNLLDDNSQNRKVYMLISKNLKLPFSESDVLVISDDISKVLKYANKKLQEYVYMKGYRTKKAFNNIKDIENELKRCWKVQFTLADNTNVGQELSIKERILV